jgi:hypothetical protein
MRQARLALLKQGLLDTVNGAVQGLAGTEGEAARITWEYATEVKRGDALVTSLTTTLSWSEVQLDELFDLAAKL